MALAQRLGNPLKIFELYKGSRKKVFFFRGQSTKRRGGAEMDRYTLYWTLIGLTGFNTDHIFDLRKTTYRKEERYL